jgi:YtoQ family protein
LLLGSSYIPATTIAGRPRTILAWWISWARGGPRQFFAVLFDAERNKMEFIVYLAGEIHSDWRDRIAAGIASASLPVNLVGPVTDHEASDNVGVDILGAEDSAFWKDHKGGKINAVRTRTAIRQADLVVVRFGEKYKQWNAAFDAGYAVALGKPIITLHDDSLNHALKEVDAAAQAVAETPEQVVEILKYVTTKP